MASTAPPEVFHRLFLSYVRDTPALRDVLVLQGSAALHFYYGGKRAPADLDFISSSIGSPVMKSLREFGRQARATYEGGLRVEICLQQGARTYRDIAVSPSAELMTDKIVAAHRSLGKRSILERKHIADIAHLMGRTTFSPREAHEKAKKYGGAYWDRGTNNLLMEALSRSRADEQVMRIMERCFR
jgi:hypothetical protein